MARRAKSVLAIELTRDVEEAGSGHLLFGRDTLALFEITEAIRRGCRDAAIKGLLVRIDGAGIGWAKAESLHHAIRAFRDTGKPAFAILSSGGNSSYFVAAAAGQVGLDPAATLDVHALGSESFFLRDLLGELGVEPELDAIGEFKSSGEMFTRREASEASRLQTDEIVLDLHQQLVSKLSEARSLPPETVAESFDRGPLLSHEALERKLVDFLAADSDAEEILEEALGGPVRLLPFRRYLRRRSLRRRLWRWRRPQIAVVHVAGLITAGEGRRAVGPRAAPARALAELLGSLRKNSRVKAIVLRVDSPGGGAVASDRLRRVVQATASEKPVVVSMGDIAASGGYYIATAASSVVAGASTLTGSIGVIGGKFVVRRLLDRLGINRELRSAGRNAEFYSPFHSFTADERARHRELLRHFYETKFLPAVAEGRGLGRDEADRVARGRVWTGRQAQARGLVDSLGGTEDAIVRACERAGISRERARVVVVEPKKRLADWIFHGAWGSPGLSYLAESLSILEDLSREDLLLLAPRFLRIR
ncbi:MAG TPA: signal peptide peptidase SppA [Vicinamibacteria bacterium]|nr:signal peptide peptidase SppA [Vicinamibacteria bacterium]